MFPTRRPLPTFNWDFEYQPIASGILTQPKRYKRTDRQTDVQTERHAYIQTNINTDRQEKHV